MDDDESWDDDDSDVEDACIMAAVAVAMRMHEDIMRPHASNIASEEDEFTDEEEAKAARMEKEAKDEAFMSEHKAFFHKQWNHLLEYPVRFQEVFRLNRRAFRMVSKWVEEGIARRRGRGRPPSLSPQEHLLLLLYHLGQGTGTLAFDTTHTPPLTEQMVCGCGAGTTFRAMAFVFPFARSTIADAVSRTVRILVEDKWNTLVRWPSHEECEEISAGFRSRSPIRGAVLLVDCTHVPVRPPGARKHEYLNRKGWFSINVQFMVRPLHDVCASSSPSCQ